MFQASDKFRFKPATRVENACATGSAAVHQAIKTIEAKRARTVLVVGVEQMTRTPGPEIGNILLKASYLPEDGDTPGGFAGVFGQIAGTYFQRYGDQSDALALIAAKNHKNGVDNPYAQMRKDLGFEFCRAESDKNPFVAGPLKRTDCSLVSDGAAALVLADTETACDEARRRLPRHGPCAGFPAHVEARHRPVRGLRRGLAARLDQAGIQLTDLSFVETHDCFTIAELIEYEAMGLTPRARGATAVKKAGPDRDGRLPVNPLRRPQGQGASDRRRRRLHACALRHAALREAGGIR